MKCLVAGDQEDSCQRIRAVLLENSLDCPPAYVVSSEVAADRAGRLHPALVIVVLDSDHERSLQTLHSIRQTADSYLVVVGPADNSKLILRAMQEGADEYLDQSQVESEVNGAIARCKSHRTGSGNKEESRGRVISVLACSGGSGASTVAVNISGALAKHHSSCGLIDLRLSTGDLAPLLDMRTPYNLVNLAENLEDIDDEMFERLFARHASGVHLLAAPANLNGATRVDDRVVRQAIAMARRRFPYVVIDVDHSLNIEQLEALWQSEIILIVLRLDYISIRNTRRTMEHLRQLGLDLERVRLVANRYGEQKQVNAKQAEELLQKKIAHFIPNDSSRINAAINAGIPVALQSPFAKISRRLAALAQSVNGQHKVEKAKSTFFKSSRA